jgi:hypothetical protein
VTHNSGVVSGKAFLLPYNTVANIKHGVGREVEGKLAFIANLLL